MVATFLFASHDALSKFLGGLYPVVMVVWARYVVHTLLMAGIFLPKSGLNVLRTRRPVLQTLRALSLLSTSLLFTTGLQYLPLAEATSVNFLARCWSLHCRRPCSGAGDGRAVGGGGVGLHRCAGGSAPRGAMFTPAILYPFGSALGFCFYQLLTRILAAYDSPTTSNFYAGLCNTLVMSALVPFFWEVPRWDHALLMLALGGFGMSAHLLLTQAFRHAAPALLAPFSYCQIVFAGLLGLLIYGQVPDSASLLGIAIICLSGLGAAWMQRKK